MNAMAPKRPRYSVIAEWLVGQCQALQPGSLLPSEAELAARFDVSRMTARQAVQQLEHAGLIERRRGSGTFVAPRPLHRNDGVLLSFTEDMARRGMTGSSRIVLAEVATAPEQAAILGMPADAWIVRLVRVRFADGRSLAIERVALPGEFSAVLDYDLERGSLHDILRSLGRIGSHATGQVSARIATQDEADLLGLNSPAALLVESRVIYDAAGRPLESTETAYVASRWVLDSGSYAAAKEEASAAATAAPIAPADVPSTPSTT